MYGVMKSVCSILKNVFDFEQWNDLFDFSCMVEIEVDTVYN